MNNSLTIPVVENWRVEGNNFVTKNTNTMPILVPNQTFAEGNIVEIDVNSVIRLGKPAPDMVHTKRICAIFKDIIKDIEKQERRGYLNPLTAEVIAYTTNPSLPNITKAEVLGMIKELGF